MQNNLLLSKPHRRYNPLKDEWILVSPQRTKRPWKGKRENVELKQPDYDPLCYLCPGNTRANGERNPDYINTFVFDNDFPAILETTKNAHLNESTFFHTETVNGICRVACFSPKHNLTLAKLTPEEIEIVINTWIKEVNNLSKYQWVQIFENKGEVMGCSNPHPHGQIWASNFVPNEIKIEDTQQKKYFEKNNSILLLDYLKKELREKERMVWENDNWAIVVPFWAIWPYETLLLPKTNITSLINLSGDEIRDLAEITKKLLVTYDRLFNTSMPYSMGWHFAPFNGKGNIHWLLHAHYYPPLLRSATVKKFMVGYEMLAEAQRDITPEEAVDNLKKFL